MVNVDKSLQSAFNKRLTPLQLSGIRAFNNRVSTIPGLIKMTLGEPDFNTPDHVKMAGIKGIVNNDTHYASQMGTPNLLKSISHYLKVSQNLDYDPKDEIVVTNGATEAIYATFNTIFNPGDEILVPTPAYSLYFPIIKLTGAKPVCVDVSKNGFQLTPEQLSSTIKKENGKIKAVLLNYPGNPTGAEYSEDNLKALAKVIKANHIFCVADEIYCELVYGMKHVSIAHFAPANTILLNGVSKSHAMTGWRIGYAAGPKQVIDQISKIHSYITTAISTPSQDAATEALTNGLKDPLAFRKVYDQRRRYIVKSLNDMGMKTLTPQGAFYAFPHIPKSYGNDDQKFAVDIAYHAKVGLTPGHVFGPGGEGHVRLSYATSMANIKEAMRRIHNYLKN